MENYLKEVISHKILGQDEILMKFLSLNSNDFIDLKNNNNIYDLNSENSSFLKIHHANRIMSFYQFYEHAQAYLCTKYNVALGRQKLFVNFFIIYLLLLFFNGSNFFRFIHFVSYFFRYKKKIFLSNSTFFICFCM